MSVETAAGHRWGMGVFLRGDYHFSVRFWSPHDPCGVIEKDNGDSSVLRFL
jgi:hypothetical protein